MLATSRNEPLSAVSAPFHDAFPRHNDIDRMHSFAGQARRFSDDGSVFSFDDHDFGCPLKRKDNSNALVPPPFSLIEALSWSPFDDGHDDNHDGEGSSTAFPTLSANVPTKARMDTESNESTTAHSSQEKQELQKAARASVRRSRRRGAGGSFPFASTKGRAPAHDHEENACDKANVLLFEEQIESTLFKATFDGLASRTADGLNGSSHSDSSRQRRGGSTTNFDYLPMAQRAHLHKSASLRHMRREESQRSLMSAVSSKTDACVGRSRPRGRLSGSANESTKDRSRARSRSLGAVPGGAGNRSPAGGRGTVALRSSPRSNDELRSSVHTVGSSRDKSVNRKTIGRRDSPREGPGVAAVWKDLCIPTAPAAVGLSKADTKEPRDVPELASMWEDFNIPRRPTAAGHSKSAKLGLSSASDPQCSRRGASRRSSPRMTSTRRPTTSVVHAL